jgi:hypothetical protein
MTGEHGLRSQIASNWDTCKELNVNIKDSSEKRRKERG